MRRRRTGSRKSRQLSCLPPPRAISKRLSRSSGSEGGLLCVAAAKTLTGGFDKDIKTLVKKGRDAIDKDMEQALEIASTIGASVIDGAAGCGKDVKDDLENPTLFDEWLIECERMFEATGSLKNFDESTGEDE